MGGLTVDRRETNHFHAIEKMDGKEIEERLAKLRKENPQAFIEAEYEVLDDTKTGDTPVEKIEGKDTPALAHNPD